MSEAVIVATYNEATNGPAIVRAIKGVCPGAMVIVVDDNSPDGTSDAVRALGLPGVEVITRKGSRGYGTAVRDGLRRACELGVERVATMDADFSHNPRALPKMFEALDKADVAIGSRYIGGVRVLNWEVRRLLLSLFANTYVRTVLGLRPHDCTSGYRAYRREILEQLDLGSLQSNGYAFLVEMLWRAKRHGARMREVPIVFTERKVGESKMSGGVIFESMVMPWRLRLMGSGAGARKSD